MEGTQAGGARQAEGARGGPGPTRADAKRLQKTERGEKNSREEGGEGEGREERRAGRRLLDPEHDVSAGFQVLAVTLDLGPPHVTP